MGWTDGGMILYETNRMVEIQTNLSLRSNQADLSISASTQHQKRVAKQKPEIGIC